MTDKQYVNGCATQDRSRTLYVEDSSGPRSAAIYTTPSCFPALTRGVVTVFFFLSFYSSYYFLCCLVKGCGATKPVCHSYMRRW